MRVEEKFNRLLDGLRSMESVLVAFSGGVDSTFLLHAARKALGDRAAGALAVSPSLARLEREEARSLAARIGARLIEVETREMENPEYRKNAPDRCYFCKTELFETLGPLAEREGFRVVAYGEIVDDAADWRPGARAAKERSIRAPLAEAGLTKAEIRELSAAAGLPTADKPAFACLSSRIPHGSEVTVPKLRQVDEAEEALRALGFRQYRVRHHGDVARIEVDPKDIGRALELRTEIADALKRTGFKFVTIDLDGYRRPGFTASGAKGTGRFRP